MKVRSQILTLIVACTGLSTGFVGAGDVRSDSGSSVIWQHVNVPNGRYGLPVCPALGHDSSIYVVANKGNLSALSHDGSEKWSYNLGEDDTWADVAIDGNETVYVASRTLHALNPDGSLKWKTRRAREPISAVAIGGQGEIYFVREGKLCSADAGGTIKWERRTFGNFWFPPVIGSDGTIYVDGREQGAINARIHAFKPDGTLKWTFSIDRFIAQMIAAPALDDRDVLYFAASERDLYAVNRDGGLHWIFRTDRQVSSTAAIGEDRTIYFGCLDGCLYAVKPDGELKWKFRTGGTVVSSPAIDRSGNIYFSSRDGNLYCLDPNGAPVRTIHFDSPGSGSPIIGPDGTIYLSDVDYLYAIRGSIPPATSSWPMKRHDARGTGRAVPHDTHASIAGRPLWTAFQAPR